MEGPLGGRERPVPGGVQTHTRRCSVGMLCNRLQMRWPPSSPVVLQITGPVNTGERSIWNPWGGEGEGQEDLVLCWPRHL